MNLILPIAGSSSRYPNIKPKFLLIHPNSTMMIIEAIKGLNLHQFKKIIVVGLEEHNKKYDFLNNLIAELSHYNHYIDVHLLKTSTKNQPETVYEGIKRSKITDDILIKDCDNYFELNCEGRTNFVAVADLHKQQKVIAANKSYVNIGHKNIITNIIEKQVIGNLFCCGGYYFNSSKEYCSYYEELKKYDNLYISHIIYKMILDKKVFVAKEVKNYIDWGTLEDWLEYRKQFSTIFIDLDGVLIESGNQYYKPRWGETSLLQDNIDIINQLYDTKKVTIIITTARPKSVDKFTKQQLKKYNIKYHYLFSGLPHSQRILINDYATSNPYPSAIAINLERNTDKLRQLLQSIK